MSKAEVEELIDLILFGDLDEAPWELIADKVSGEQLLVDYLAGKDRDEEQLTRISAAATIAQKYRRKES